MDKNLKYEIYDNLFQNLVKPIKNMPFETIIKGLSGYDLLPFDKIKDCILLDKLHKSINKCYENIKNQGGIFSDRPNEVGNYIEQPVIEAINQLNIGLIASRPKTKKGKLKNSGYPDILITHQEENIYLEIKTFNKKSSNSAFRSFYLSPSAEFKISCDAKHLLLAFEMQQNEKNYMPISYKLITLEHLKCQIKHEFNANNIDLYTKESILLSEEFK